MLCGTPSTTTLLGFDAADVGFGVNNGNFTQNPALRQNCNAGISCNQPNRTHGVMLSHVVCCVAFMSFQQRLQAVTDDLFMVYI